MTVVLHFKLFFPTNPYILPSHTRNHFQSIVQSNHISKLYLLSNNVYYQIMCLNDIFKIIPLDIGHKFNGHKTFERRPGRFLNTFYTLNLRLRNIF